MSNDEDQPARVLVLVVPACEPERALPEHLMRIDRLWKDVFGAVQRTVPGAAELQPGRCAMRARGPTRYYGSEAVAARAVLDCVAELLQDGFRDGVAVGVASGRFAAEQAATADERTVWLHSPSPGVRLVEPERTAEFLSGLPIECAADELLAPVLVGLGIRTLGAFAALPEQAVLQRFGKEARIAHRRARALGELHGSEVSDGAPLRDLSVSCEFEPPLEGVDQLAFACSTPAERFARGLSERGLVCTELRVELTDDASSVHERTWSHPAHFTATDIVNRVRWQAATLPAAPERGGAGVASIRIAPERTAPAASHEPGLWSNAPEERVHHQLTRVQSLIGPEGVGTGMIIGGRISTDRQRLIPWGARRESASAAGPWPGHLMGPLPNVISTQHAPARLIDENQAIVLIDADELLSESPAFFVADGVAPRAVRAWSTPWPLREHWWHSRTGHEALYRLQIVLDDGEAWLLRYTASSGWAAEGRYA